MAADVPSDNPAGLVAYWLVPEQPDFERLAARIGALAARHQAPCFDPHATLLVTTLRPHLPMGSILEALSREFAPFEVEALACQHSAERFKALFLPIGDDVVHRMHLRILELAGGGIEDGSFEPHLSLLYKILPEQQRAALAAAEPLSDTRIRFDRVVALFPARGHHDFNDVSGWRQVDGRQLIGATE